MIHESNEASDSEGQVTVHNYGRLLGTCHQILLQALGCRRSVRSRPYQLQTMTAQ